VVKAVVLVDRQEGGLENIKRRVADATAIVTKDELLEEYRRSRLG
jgi:orotate phosphoribosyltransferase